MVIHRSIHTRGVRPVIRPGVFARCGRLIWCKVRKSRFQWSWFKFLTECMSFYPVRLSMFSSQGKKCVCSSEAGSCFSHFWHGWNDILCTALNQCGNNRFHTREVLQEKGNNVAFCLCMLRLPRYWLWMLRKYPLCFGVETPAYMKPSDWQSRVDCQSQRWWTWSSEDW